MLVRLLRLLHLLISKWAIKQCDEENIFFANLSNELYIFIGITDQAEEGVWKLFNGEPASYLPWDSQQPNGGTNENFVHMVTAQGVSGGDTRPLGAWIDTDDPDIGVQRATYCTFEPIETHDQFCFSFKTEFATDAVGTNEIEFSFNDAPIHRFVTGVDDPPLCLPENNIDTEFDNFKFKSTGNGVSWKTLLNNAG